ncbi:aspartate kinase [Clostridium sp. 'deep sea']|uniref:aspartate kinase n=1 Tax=Clostridium sp. 'deep sea' TaxID=2779445 RepID=UPI0018966D2A|nr:aspartate kinase [Clostridium sp. 'deep sea']QOR35802.1 aspartate kinase [Clostridium sp. 'deep sea']
MRILVQKYGGTSVATEEARQLLADSVKNAEKKDYKLVIVVSAMGRLGQPYATDTLLSLIDNKKEVVPSREKDLLMSCGEIISAVVVAAKIQQEGLKAKVLTGFQAGIKTTSNFNNARIINIDTKRIIAALENNKVVIVAGFQGMDKNNDITTLGRGGSDTTAIALGIALEAERVEIYTDVTGVMTADPRVAPEAYVMNKISYQELFQMTSKGAKVVHPRAVELAMEHHIPLLVATANNAEQGTLIIDSESERTYENKVGRVITAIAHMKGLVQFNIKNLGANQSKKLYESLADAGVSLDLINIGTIGHHFVTNKSSYKKAIYVMDKLNLEYQVTNNVSKVSCIGAGMHNQPGVLSQIVSTLVENEIEILQTSDSHMTITCLVKEADTNEAVRLLHQKFCTSNYN